MHRTMALKIYLLVFIIISSVTSDESFGVCPSSHPYVFSLGSCCCALPCGTTDCLDLDPQGGLYEISERKNVSSAAREGCDNYTMCKANGGKCEDRFSLCNWEEMLPREPDATTALLSRVEVTDFGDEWDGIYSHTLDNYVGNRPVYDMGDNCVWWNREFRHWWLGHCQNVGENTGRAYLKPDEDCPFHRDTERVPITGRDPWIDPNTEQPIPYAWITSSSTVVTLGKASGSTSATAGGADARVRPTGNRYSRRCTWKKKNGRWRCVRRNSG